MQSAQSGDSVRLIRYTVKINKVSGVLKMLNKKNAVLFLCIVFGAVIFTVNAIENKGSKLFGIKNEKEEPGFSVSFATPQGELPAFISYPSIQVQFSEPVVALEALGMKSNKSEYVSIEPELKGYWKWISTNTISFESEDKALPQKSYKIKINKRIKSISGLPLKGQSEFEFYTEGLKLISIVPGYNFVKENIFVDPDSVYPETAKDIALVFNSPVNLNVINRFVKVFSSNKTYTFKASQLEPEKIHLQLNETPSEDELIYVKLPAGSYADEGFLATSNACTLSFRTMKPFKLEQAYLSLYDAGSNPIKLVFNSYFKENSESEIAKCISTTLPGFKLTEENISVAGRFVTLSNLPVVYESKFKIFINSSLTDSYGRRLSENYVEEIEIPAAKSFASFKNYGKQMLEAQFYPKLVFQHQNVLEGSRYSLKSTASATGQKINSEPDVFYIDPKEVPKNTLITQAVDLAPYLQKVGDEYHGEVEFNASMKYESKYWDWSEKKYVKDSYTIRNNQVVQVTDLGATVRFGNKKAAVLVTSLRTGKPVPNAKVNMCLYEGGMPQASAVTDKNGLAILNYNRLDTSDELFLIEVKTDTDRIIFNASTTNIWNYGINYVQPRYARKERNVPFIFTDRGLYKPGETVTFKVIDRKLIDGEYVIPANYKFLMQLKGYYNGPVYGEVEGVLDENGCASGQFVIPENISPGTYFLYFEMDGYLSTESIEIQFFDRLRFEVKTTVPDITFYKGDNVSAEVFAQYLGGGSLGGENFTSSWTCQPSYFASENKNLEKFSFGPKFYYEGTTSLSEKSGSLDTNGRTTISQKTGDERIIGAPYTYRCEVEVSDAGGQYISSSKSMTVHPAKYYIGVNRKGTSYPEKGTVVKFNYVCVKPDGKTPALSDFSSDRQMKVELIRKDWKEVQQRSWNGQINTSWQKVDEVEADWMCSISASETPAEISVVPEKGGDYVLRLSSEDSLGRKVVTEVSFYVTGGEWYWHSGNNSQEITITPDKSEYNPGDVAKLLVQSPLEKGTYMITVEREGILSEKILTLTEPATVIEVPVIEKYLPVVYIGISSYSVRNGPPQNDFDTPDLDKPKGYFGITPIFVSTKSRSFDIEISTDKPSYKPGEKATVKIKASKNGNAVPNASITLMAVDRGVIDLIGYHVPNPVKFFYDAKRFPCAVAGGDSRYYLIDPVTYEIKNLVGGDSESNDVKLNVRKNFDPTAKFEPNLVTDKKGEAVCSFVLPDSLTSYRITAVGVKENSFTIAEDEMSVSNPVSVRHVLPRQLRINDKGEVGVVISNLSEKDSTVNISLSVYSGVEKTGLVENENKTLRLPGNASVSGISEQKVKVKSETTVPVMFTISGTKDGWVTVEFTVKSELVNEIIRLPLKIERPFVFETVTTFGTIENKFKREMISVPHTLQSFGKFYIQLDATRLGNLREAVDYVFNYPYGCMEQRSSKVLPLVAFGEYIDVFGLNSEVKDPLEVAEYEIASWAKSQCDNGGFPYWPGGKDDNLYVSSRIAEIFGIMRSKNLEISTEIDVDGLARYLVDESNVGIEKTQYMQSYAYAYYAASLLGAKIPEERIKLMEKRSFANPITLSYVGLIYLNNNRRADAERIEKLLRKQISFTTRGVDVQIKTDDYFWMDDESYTLAAMLMFYSKFNPKDDVNTHLIYELLKLQSIKGYWESTDTTSRVMVAVNSYITGRNLKSLDFTAQVDFNNEEFVKGSFKGVGAKPVEKEIPISDLKEFKGQKVPLVIRKDGTGDLYYTVSMKYEIPVGKQIPRDEGICIYTEIYDIETGRVVDSNELVQGKVYRERVYVSSTKSLEYVAVRVPVPAGCEIINSSFETTSSKYSNKIYSSASNIDFYDSEVQYFWDRLSTVTTTSSFLFRAARKGTYHTPCATAECMYEDEIFGRTAGKLWIIK